MPLTRPFSVTMQQRVAKDRAFRGALLHECMGALLQRDRRAGNALLVAYVRAIVPFRPTHP
jgi:hypothetical protein